MRIWRYFFPRRKPRERLPLASRRYSSAHSVYCKVPEELKHSIRRMLTASIARTESDAYRLIQANPGLSADQIIKRYKRHRRRTGRLARAWQRLKDIL